MWANVNRVGPRQRVPFPSRQLLVGRLLRRRRRHRRRPVAGRRARIHGSARAGAGDVRAAARLRHAGRPVGRRQRGRCIPGRAGWSCSRPGCCIRCGPIAAAPSASPSPSISACERAFAISAWSAAVPGARRSPASRAAPDRRVTPVVARSRCLRSDRTRPRQSGLSAGRPARRRDRGRRRSRRALGACDVVLLVCPAQAVRELAAPAFRRGAGRHLRQGHRGIERPSDARGAGARSCPAGRSPCCRDRASPRRRCAACRPRSASRPSIRRSAAMLAGVAGGGRVPAVLDARRAGRGAGRRGQERARHRRRRRRGPRARPQRGRRAGHARLRRDGAARPGDGRGARDADGLERPRRSGADLPRSAVAQPLARAWRWARARRLPTTWPAAARSSKARRRRRRCWRAPRDTTSRCRFAPPSMLSCMSGADLDEAIRALLARPLRREGE